MEIRGRREEEGEKKRDLRLRNNSMAGERAKEGKRKEKRREA